MDGLSVMRQGLRSVLMAVCLAGLSGCDYWPPALQTQIEQLRSELQTARMEQAQLQGQVTAATKAKEDLQVQVDELARLNREKASMVASLQSQMAAERDKAAKLAKSAGGKSSKKTAAKPTAKTVTKTTAKKKSTKTAGAHRH